MDLDNYDPSDFLQMSSKKETSVKIEYSNIKQEPQSQAYEQESFSMSEMLLYEKRTTKLEHSQQSESSEMTVQSQVINFSSQETYSLDMTSSQQSTTQSDRLDDVAIHDDLAISDSDEEPQPGEISRNQSENANDNDSDLWF